MDPHSFGQRSTGPSPLQPAPACVTLLGLAWPCTQQDVKQAFRSQAKTAHPDAGGSNEAFQTLYKAYQEALALVR
jgi:curved DNA-binding protein CbpA